jgi:hypothetical protein
MRTTFETQQGYTGTQSTPEADDGYPRFTDHGVSPVSARASGPDDNLLLDLAKGALAGAAAVWVMDRVGWALWRMEDREDIHREYMARPDGLDPAHVVANRVADALDRPLSPKQPHPAGIAVHYALGVVPAMAYAAMRRDVPEVAAGRGLLYGLGLFLLEDEGVAPLLGLASGPTAYPWQAHARGLVSHLVLGAATHAVLDLLD